MDFLYISFEFFRIFLHLLIITLLHGFIVPAAMNKCGRIHLPHLGIFSGNLLQVFRCILHIDTESWPCTGNLFIDRLVIFSNKRYLDF